MSTHNNGGSAFPEIGPRGQASGFEGMSLRDYFAGMAMNGFCTDGTIDFNTTAFDIAVGAYEMADAMLKAREA